MTPHGTHAQEWVDYENQPSCHMAHLFTYAGAPWLTQYWVRRVKDEAYGDATPSGGYNGDEDQGQMGGLGVLMAMGLFDVTGRRRDRAALRDHEPAVRPRSPWRSTRVTTRARPSRIVTRGNVPENVYIQSATLDGRPLNDRFWITHKELTSGGTLEITLGPAPNKRWGVTRASSR